MSDMVTPEVQYVLLQNFINLLKIFSLTWRPRAVFDFRNFKY